MKRWPTIPVAPRIPIGSFVLIAMNTPVYRRKSRGIAKCATPQGLDFGVAMAQVRESRPGQGGARQIASPPEAGRCWRNKRTVGAPDGGSQARFPFRKSGARQPETLSHGRQGTVAAVACCRLEECGRGLRESGLGKS